MNIPVCLLDFILCRCGADAQLVIELCLLDHLGYVSGVDDENCRRENRWVVVVVVVVLLLLLQLLLQLARE